jgi:hypothetical protein
VEEKLMRVVRVLTVPVMAVLAVADLAAPDTAQAKPDDNHTWHLSVLRDHPDVRVPVVVRRSGEALIDLNAAAPGTDWAVAGTESARVSVSVDGRYATDLVVSGGQPLHRQLALGHLTSGPHQLRARSRLPRRRRHSRRK